LSSIVERYSGNTVTDRWAFIASTLHDGRAPSHTQNMMALHTAAKNPLSQTNTQSFDRRIAARQE
jgi:hypothetical protein